MADTLLGQEQAQVLVDVLSAVDAGNPLAATRRAAAGLGALTLSDRARALAHAVLMDIEGDHARLVRIVREAMQHPGFEGWPLWPVGLSVAWRSLGAGSPEAFDAGMTMLRELTPRMTSEFSVRPFLRQDAKRALAQMGEWADDQDWHVRRLASEGSRPLLPWAERIPAIAAEPGLTRPILDALHDDPEESVRRSVANHLNDHSRSHAAFTVETVTGWRARGGDHVERTIRHALRTLVKRGDPGALGFLGFSAQGLAVSGLTVRPAAVPQGGTVEFRAAIRNTGHEDAALMIDYVLFFPDARGRERTKVFKLAKRRLGPGEQTTAQAVHSFAELSTRRYYPGGYGIALQVNGTVHGRCDFTVGLDERG